MKKEIKRVVVLTIGIIFITLGVLGLALPFLQGVLFLIIGFILVSFYFPKTNLWIKKHIEKHPYLQDIVSKIEIWLIKIIGKK